MEPKVLVIALEKGSESKREHLQGYIRFDGQVRLSAIIARMGNVHARPRIASEEAAIQYILDVKSYLEKSDDPHPKEQGLVLMQHGVKPKYTPQGRREYKKGDVEREVVERLRKGETIQSIHDDHPVYVFRNIRLLRGYVRLLEAWGYRDDGLSVSNGAGVEL